MLSCLPQKKLRVRLSQEFRFGVELLKTISIFFSKGIKKRLFEELRICCEVVGENISSLFYVMKDKSVFLQFFLDARDFDYERVDFSHYMWENIARRPRFMGKCILWDYGEDTKAIWKCGEEYRKHRGKYPEKYSQRFLRRLSDNANIMRLRKEIFMKRYGYLHWFAFCLSNFLRGIWRAFFGFI